MNSQNNFDIGRGIALSNEALIFRYATSFSMVSVSVKETYFRNCQPNDGCCKYRVRNKKDTK